MSKLFTVVSALTFVVPTIAKADGCYHKPGDQTETITETSDGSLVWQNGKSRVTFETGGGGTGLPYRLAFDKKGKGFRYEFKGDNLVFGGVTYVVGCK